LHLLVGPEKVIAIIASKFEGWTHLHAEKLSHSYISN